MIICSQALMLQASRAPHRQTAFTACTPEGQVVQPGSVPRYLGKFFDPGRLGDLVIQVDGLVDGDEGVGVDGVEFAAQARAS
ncbi:hypothetical protein [Streptomyces sp. NPDC000880]